MKPGDIVTGLTPQELLYSEMVCHKVNGEFGIGPYVIVCGEKSLPCMSHSEWKKVTCKKCLSIGEGRVENRKM